MALTIFLLLVILVIFIKKWTRRQDIMDDMFQSLKIPKKILITKNVIMFLRD